MIFSFDLFLQVIHNFITLNFRIRETYQLHIVYFLWCNWCVSTMQNYVIKPKLKRKKLSQFVARIALYN